MAGPLSWSYGESDPDLSSAIAAYAHCTITPFVALRGFDPLSSVGKTDVLASELERHAPLTSEEAALKSAQLPGAFTKRHRTKEESNVLETYTTYAVPSV